MTQQSRVTRLFGRRWNLGRFTLYFTPAFLRLRIATNWTVQVSTPGIGKQFPLLRNRPDKLLDPPSHLFNGYRGARLNTHLQLVLGLRMSATIPLLPLYAVTACRGTPWSFVRLSWRMQGHYLQTGHDYVLLNPYLLTSRCLLISLDTRL
jgi:hypothetical protein